MTVSELIEMLIEYKGDEEIILCDDCAEYGTLRKVEYGKAESNWHGKNIIYLVSE